MEKSVCTDIKNVMKNRNVTDSQKLLPKLSTSAP